jgi:preprotein translocase subunit SecA
MLNTFFQPPSKKILFQYEVQLKQILSFEKQFSQLDDLGLKNKTKELQIRLLNTKNSDSILEESFALVKEATYRVLKIRHFDVQLIGGLILNEGKIAEMKTGEGKTIVALLPSFFNALYGKSVHVVTANDYLAQRDAEIVGQVHRFLGLSVGLIQENTDTEQRVKNYSCDIVYVTNNELGFDYLRDNMAFTKDELVQQPFYYALVDEVDSILIDEARTPLIISGPSQISVQKYLKTAKLATILKLNIHYNVDEKNQNVLLTDTGIDFCEQALAISDLYSVENSWVFYILNSLKAKELFKKNTNYIINENQEIIIVDEFTGRTMFGRRWGDGLHQAIEAKENVPIQDESQTLASITYQNLFLLYKKLSGMTGTAKTEEGEFEKIYNLSVVQIPTNQPLIRKDFPDFVYKNQYAKWKAIADECLTMYSLERPVLIGTSTIEKSELLAALLHEYGIPYQLLNARPENVERESDIIAQSGCKRTVTISTNMAGRGTDIVLGGNPLNLSLNLLKAFCSEDYKFSDLENSDILFKNNVGLVLSDEIREKSPFLIKEIVEMQNNKESLSENPLFNIFEKIYSEKVELTKRDRETVRNLGGLHVIGTERHESRRIDNQLRGRAGRQGDPGSSRFFLSLEDKLLRLFGGDEILNLLQNIGFEDNTPIQSSFLNQSLESAQKKIESYYFDTRKQLFEYDQALTMQRDGVYKERRRILVRNNLRDWIFEYAERSLDDLVNFNENIQTNNLPQRDFFSLKLHELLSLPFKLTVSLLASDNKENLVMALRQQFRIAYDLKEIELENIESGLLRELERCFLLNQIDFAWKEHLQKISFLRDSIRWRAYGQKNPLTEYKGEAFSYFTIMLSKIRHRVTYLVLKSKIIIK